MNENNNKGLLFSVVGVLTLIVAIVGATYAYFQATASNAGTISGTAASGGLDLTVALSSTNATGNLVPQKDAAIQSAVTGISNKSCVDANGNTVCKVYTITVTNTGTATVVVNGTISLSASTMANLKWTTGTSATAGFTGANAKTVTTLASDVSLAANASKPFYVVVWISETGSAQNSSDRGSFTGTITFNSANNGVTSTITG